MVHNRWPIGRGLHQQRLFSEGFPHLFTPTTNTPVLPGIARKTVCELAIANKIELVEKDLSIDDLLGADEVFITNVIMQVMPVVGIEKHTVGDGKPGPVTKKIQEYYDEFVKNIAGEKMKVKDIAEQIEKIVPLGLAQDWDNVGLLLGSADKNVKSILLTIDITRTFWPRQNG